MKTATFLRVGSGNIAPRWLGLLAIAGLLLGAASLMAQSSATKTTVTTLGGGPQSYNPGNSFGSSNSINGTLNSQFHTPSGVAFDDSVDYLYVADRDNNAIRLVDLSTSPGKTYTFAPYPPYVPTNLISQPVGVAVDALGDVFVLNRGKGTNGTVVEFDYFGDLLATNMIRLTNACGIALDTSNNIYVTASNTVFKITPAGASNVVVTIPNAGASLQGIVVKKSGTTAGLLAVCDSGRNGIYLIDPTTGAVTTNAGFNGIGDGTGSHNQGVLNANAQFFKPSGLAEAGDGSLIVADFGNDRVKVVTTSGITTNLYGVYSNYWWTGTTPTGGTAFLGWSDGVVWQPDGGTGNVQARMPFGVAIGPDGAIYTTEDYYHIIRKVTGTNIQPPPLPPPPPPAPPVPVIGTVSFPAPNYVSLLTPVTSFIFNNDVLIAIEGTNGTETLYTSQATGSVPDPTTNSSTAPPYQDGLPFSSVLGLDATQYEDMTIKAITVNGDGESSPVTSARFQFVVANPTISGNNAGQFTVTDITTNAVMYYTLDGTDPTNDGSGTSIGPISSGATLSLQIPTGTNLTFNIRGFRPNYKASYTIPAVFTPAAFVANTISFGFASGEASSDFVGTPGQTFYAPVTLTTLPNTAIYSLQFNVTVTNAGPNPGPVIGGPPAPFGFSSMLLKPLPPDTNFPSGVLLYTPIPPMMFVSGSGFTNLVFTNLSANLLGVGWVERYTQTNLYNTLSQDLIKYSQAHDDLFPNPQQPNGVIVGGYSFTIPANAAPGQTYQIQIGRPSATDDGIGTPGSSVYIATPTNGSLVGGAINAIKNVTVGSRKYLVGNVYPFGWFNAGDFGNANLQNADVEQVFEAAIYKLNSPASQAPGSDFFDAMDSCGVTYANNGYGYLQPNTAVANTSILFDGNDTTINQIAFGDGKLDVCDVYVTYRRSLDPTLTWFHRFWTNDVANGFSGRAAETTPNTFNSSAVKQSSGGKVLPAFNSNPGPVSITNKPSVNFTAGDFQGSRRTDNPNSSHRLGLWFLSPARGDAEHYRRAVGRLACADNTHFVFTRRIAGHTDVGIYRFRRAG